MPASFEKFIKTIPLQQSCSRTHRDTVINSTCATVGNCRGGASKRKRTDPVEVENAPLQKLITTRITEKPELNISKKCNHHFCFDHFHFADQAITIIILKIFQRMMV